MLNVKYQKVTKGDWAMAKVRKSKFKAFLLPTGGVRGGPSHLGARLYK